MVVETIQTQGGVFEFSRWLWGDYVGTIFACGVDLVYNWCIGKFEEGQHWTYPDQLTFKTDLGLFYSACFTRSMFFIY